MLRAVPPCLAALAVVLAASSVARSAPQPDFSGTWVQNMQKSGVKPGADLKAYTNRVEQRDGVLTVVSIVQRASGETTTERTYVFGKEERQTIPNGATMISALTWKGAALVFETSAESGFISAGMTETWTLSADGRVLTKVRVTNSPLGENRQTFVLEKQ